MNEHRHWQEMRVRCNGQLLPLRCLRARTAWARRRGVGARGGLAVGEALLLPAEPLIHMLGVEQALDLVFIWRGRISRVCVNVRPGLRLRAGGWHCLELPAGQAAQLGLRRGSTLRFEHEA